MKAQSEFKTIVEYKEYLRTHFAAMAMQGLLSSRGLQEALNADRMNWAEFAVSQADALLAELEKPI